MTERVGGRLELIRGDITCIEVDAIVNVAPLALRDIGTEPAGNERLERAVVVLFSDADLRYYQAAQTSLSAAAPQEAP